MNGKNSVKYRPAQAWNHLPPNLNLQLPDQSRSKTKKSY